MYNNNTDLCKSYDTVNKGRLLKTQEVYGTGPHTGGILEEFWECQEVVTGKNRYHGPHLQATRGTTQGGFIFPTLFNIVVENVVWNWLALAVEE